MTPPLNLTQAAKLVGVSRNTLYAAIRSGRLVCALGGRPGTKTMVTPEALQDAGFAVPGEVLEDERAVDRPERSERLERSQRSDRPERPERQDPLDFPSNRAEFQRAVDQFERAVERLERSMDAMADQIGERLERSVERALERALERVVARVLDHRAQHAVPAIDVRPLRQPSERVKSKRSVILPRIRAMKADGLSLQAITNELNAAGIPTLSGRGSWQKGTVQTLLAQDVQTP